MDQSGTLLPDSLSRLAATDLSVFIRESSWAFPTIESIHVIGLTLVVGTIVIVDLRLLGLASVRIPYSRIAAAVLPWTCVMFAVAVTAGLLLFISNPVAYAANHDFRLKLLCLALAGGNMAIFETVTARSIPAWDTQEKPPLPARLAGAISILCWIGVVIFGRRVGFSMALS